MQYEAPQPSRFGILLLGAIVAAAIAGSGYVFFNNKPINAEKTTGIVEPETKLSAGVTISFKAEKHNGKTVVKAKLIDRTGFQGGYVQLERARGGNAGHSMVVLGQSSQRTKLLAQPVPLNFERPVKFELGNYAFRIAIRGKEGELISNLTHNLIQFTESTDIVRYYTLESALVPKDEQKTRR